MTKVFVHGNPETADIWGPVVDRLRARGIEDVVLLSPPGFGAPAPAVGEATPANYAAWLAAELAAIDGPIDLVGHDWGAGHVFRIAAERPDLIRSWAGDIVGLLHPDYEWHDAARSWQTPGEGEEAIEFMVALDTDARAGAYADLGLPPEIARPMAAAFDADMGRCILELYRAAVPPYLSEQADRLAAAPRRPGLCIDATADAYVSTDLAPAVIERFGLEHLPLVDQGHWWMVNDAGADAASAGLVAFWAGLD